MVIFFHYTSCMKRLWFWKDFKNTPFMCFINQNYSVFLLSLKKTLYAVRGRIGLKFVSLSSNWSGWIFYHYFFVSCGELNYFDHCIATFKQIIISRRISSFYIWCVFFQVIGVLYTCTYFHIGPKHTFLVFIHILHFFLYTGLQKSVLKSYETEWP